ncbi:major facilitator superfamily transporter [Daldinia sp. FL1419]|nr:major facilitator superfamily transporter [Daldinia sp. FL1419]
MSSFENASISDREAIVKSPPATDRPSDKTVDEIEAQELAEEQWQPSRHEKAIIFTTAFLNLIVSLDATIIVTSLSAIIQDIGGTTTEAFWIATSYLLVNAVSMPLISSISVVIGRPVCLTFSIVSFSVGTIVCCTAQKMPVLIAGRCIQGIGGGGIHSLGLIILTDFCPLRWRPKWYGLTLGAWAIGLAAGPVIGGAIAQKTTWRWIFYLMFPMCGFGLVAVPSLLTLQPKQATFREKMGRVDWLGLFFFTCSTTLFLLGICWGGTQYSWNSAATLVPLIIGALGLIGTAFYVGCVAKNPFIPNALFGDISSIVTYLASCFHGILLYGTLYYCPLYFLSVKDSSPIDAGVATLPCSLMFAVSSIITGRLISRFNSFRWAIYSGWFLTCISTAMYTAWRVNDSKPVWVVSFMIGGMAHGIILNAQNFATQAMSKPGEEGAAAAMYIFARQFGMAIGVGMSATTFQNAMKLKLEWEGLPTYIADYSEAYIPKLHALKPGHIRDATYDAYKFGFQIVVATWLGIAVLTLFLALVFIKHADMNRKLQTEHHIDSIRMFRHLERR